MNDLPYGLLSTGASKSCYGLAPTLTFREPINVAEFIMCEPGADAFRGGL